MKEILAALLFISLQAPSWALPADEVTPIPARDYFTQVHELLENAKRSIRLVLFEIRYYPAYPKSPTNQLIRDLENAHKRGVLVEVVIEESKEHAVENAEKNRQAVAPLIRAGIPVYFDSPDTTTHDKVLVIDERYVVIGSTNWSYHAMDKNNESSVLIDSPELAAHYLNYFEEFKE